VVPKNLLQTTMLSPEPQDPHTHFLAQYAAQSLPTLSLQAVL